MRNRAGGYYFAFVVEITSTKTVKVTLQRNLHSWFQDNHIEGKKYMIFDMTHMI
jgi:hypothetical protein